MRRSGVDVDFCHSLSGSPPDAEDSSGSVEFSSRATESSEVSAAALSEEIASSEAPPESSEAPAESSETASSSAPESSEAPAESSETASSSAPESSEAAPSSAPGSSEATPSSAPESSEAAPSSAPEIHVTPSPVGEVWVNDLKDQQDRDRHGFSAGELDAYFDGALYVGDSVAQGLKLYKNLYEKDIFKNMIFNTGACYGFHNCLSPVSGKSLHPLYQGAKRTIWDMVKLTGAKRVFIAFGLNDFGYATPASLKKCLDKIRANISAVSPDTEVIILSAGNFTKDGESFVPKKNDYRTCARHRDYNQYILDYCNAAGLDYIDVTNCFADEHGYLPKQSSMDNYCHLKIELYTVWRDILYSYAANKLLGCYKNPPRMK